jgi:hypothetical protein
MVDRLFRKARLLTRPTPADTSPSRPESAKTASSPRDAPFPQQGRSERPKIVLPTSLVYGIQRMARMSPPLRASNECWFIWSISSIWFVWLIRLEIHPGEPDRPERPSNQTDEPDRVARAQGTHRAIPPLLADFINSLLVEVVPE